MDNQIAIRSSLRKDILSALHLAQQGVTTMKSRANTTVYWLGINKNISTTRYNCNFCNEIAPKTQQEPLNMRPSLFWPFQQSCAYYFEYNTHQCLPIADCFSG